MYQEAVSATLRGMELLLFAVVGLMAFGVLGFVLLTRVGRQQKTAEANADRILDESFDGSPDVTVKVNMGTLKYETVVIGAKQRGYKLAHEASNEYGPHTLIFEKV